MTLSFQRAREPQEKEQRRQSLLDAAARLLAEGGLEAVTLSAIARTADLAKSNVYRYFGSREEILLEILVDDELAWVGELEHALAPLAGTEDLARVARTIARTIAERPLTCMLISVVANVLEHNLTPEAVLRFKQRVLELSIRVGNALSVAVPALPRDRVEALLRHLHALIAGLWPMAHPAPLVADSLVEPRFASLRCDFEADLGGALSAMLHGLARGA